MSWRDSDEGSDWSRLGRPGGDWQGLRPSFDNPMTWALPIGRVAGITVRVHVFFLLFIVITLGRAMSSGSLYGPLLVAIGLGCLFGLVLLHEFGHSIACRWVDGTAEEILMWPLGGLAYCMPPNTWRAHLVTAVGGPMVNVACCLLAGLTLGLMTGQWLGVAIPNPLNPISDVELSGSLPLWTLYIFNWTSLILLLFNLLPIFPLDGGRIVQAVLWRSIGYVRSMRLSVRVGYIGAICLGVWGAVFQAWLVVGIAIFGGVTCYLTHRQLEYTERFMGGDGEIDGTSAWSTADEEDDSPSWRERRNERREEQREARDAERTRAEAQEVDDILAKIAATGIDSLTTKERRLLERATERQKQRESEGKPTGRP